MRRGERHAAEAARAAAVSAIRTESKYVRVTADALTAENRHARHGWRVRRVVRCVPVAANAAR